ncbi:MAG: pentapeptide repeat-containing protein [Candidatus Omnitrophica bacterium]|nr:pentapeptide repeat-containing protein [Candidatus Omnitrophota bacterium]
MMKCVFDECAHLPLTLSEYCWGHLPDKGAYKTKLLEAIKESKDFSEANFSKADLSQVDLSGAHLFNSILEGTDLIGADLSNSDLTHCSLKDADLTKANLANSRLWNADLSGANLAECNLSHTDLWNVKLFDAKLWRTNFLEAKSLTMKNFSDLSIFTSPSINEAGLLSAEESYRDLKRYFISNGMYNDASWASFKEKTMERRILKKNRAPNYFPSMLMNILCGYGEKPYRIIFSAIAMVFLFAVIYLSLNAVENAMAPDYKLRWSDYIYYSTVTFTTVGYGDFIPKPHALFRLLAASEAFIGVFLTGLFIFTLARKYSAR